jgi:hypothetical protein
MRGPTAIHSPRIGKPVWRPGSRDDLLLTQQTVDSSNRA